MKQKHQLIIDQFFFTHTVKSLREGDTTLNDLICRKKDNISSLSVRIQKEPFEIKLRDDIERAMKSGEVTSAVFADFSKAFDTIDFNILIHKLHSSHFSKNFLYLIFDYLSNRNHFV